MKYRNNLAKTIGDGLGLHISTIYREINRNKAKGYNHKEAHDKAKPRRYKRKGKIESNPLLRLIIVTFLREKNSPSVIAFYLKESFPDDSSMHISHEMIYQWIYKQNEHLLCSLLNTRRKKRQNRSNTYINRGISVEKKNIRESHHQADDKSMAGHLEGDLIVSAGHDAYVLALADRANMHLWGVPVYSKDPGEVCRAVIESLEHLPEGFVKIIIFDNGTELNAYKLIEKALAATFIFADSYCS